MTHPIIYLDNGATSWPKPASVGEAMVEFLNHRAGNPGRGGHFLAREAVAVEELVDLKHHESDRERDRSRFELGSERKRRVGLSIEPRPPRVPSGAPAT